MAVFPKLYKWVEGSYPLSDGMLIFPDLKNPAKIAGAASCP